MRHRFLPALAPLLAALVLCQPAHAINVADLRAEQLMLGAESMHKDLALSPNQQTLWKQSASEARAILRARERRRDKLQADLATALGAGAPELRDLNGTLDAEDSTAAAENRHLRGLWLTVNDALTDAQRVQVVQYLASQLARVDAGPAPAGEPRGGGDAPRQRGGGREPKMGGGAGGGSVSIGEGARF